MWVKQRVIIGLASLILLFAEDALAQSRVIEPRMVHLRSGEAREWSGFPEEAEAAHLEVRFAAEKNAGEWTLRLRQQDVKQAWRVTLNGQPLGSLVTDENDQLLYLPIAAGRLIDGENVLRIESPARGAASDDIRVGQMSIDKRPVSEVLREATVEGRVIDSDKQVSLPARITIVNEDGALQPVGAASDGRLAVRSGVVYTADGHTQFGLPAGKYTIYAGRGFEYSLAQASVELQADETGQRTLAI